MEPCQYCSGTGLVDMQNLDIDLHPKVKEGTHIGIIGAGVGGMALALACEHRNIPYTLYERDQSFDVRSQGYGLTMQQGGKALQSLGLATTGNGRLLGKGIHSKRHIVHLPDGTQVGEWGMKKWGREGKTKDAKRQNAHIARQELRRLIYNQIQDKSRICWGYKLNSYSEEGDCVKMIFQHEQKTNIVQKSSIIVGADGIRSVVRKQKIGEEASPMRYLGCIVILGIAPCPQSSDLTSDNESVFQTADSITRLYAMPFSKRGNETAGAAEFANVETGKGETMWQLSFPMDEKDAIELSKKGPIALKDEALRRCAEWHTPIPQLLQITPEQLISGYPVYDREVLEDEMFRSGTSNAQRVTLLGDAAHPMSPFKGQGANQALLDAVLLARALHAVFRDRGSEKSESIDLSLEETLKVYEHEMLKRSKPKVKASAEAAHFLHTELAIQEGDITRGAANAMATNSSS
jgi:2-polyprenyl-6-methoxyphenol hydroxylase-like FAD-dependent oxidoreductase